MKDKQMLLSNISFILFAIIIFIVVCLNLMDSKIAVPLVFACIGCQHLFMELRFYKDDKKTRKLHILFAIACFAFTLFMVLKTQRLV